MYSLVLIVPISRYCAIVCTWSAILCLATVYTPHAHSGCKSNRTNGCANSTYSNVGLLQRVYRFIPSIHREVLAEIDSPNIRIAPQLSWRSRCKNLAFRDDVGPVRH